jgi:hypothetical protein
MASPLKLAENEAAVLKMLEEMSSCHLRRESRKLLLDRWVSHYGGNADNAGRVGRDGLGALEPED